MPNVPPPSDSRSSDASRTLTDRVRDRVAETRSIKRVYREMKNTYQQYRRDTGRPSVPALRDAVRAFKQGPSLTSLVGVAEFLDDRSLLPW